MPLTPQQQKELRDLELEELALEEKMLMQKVGGAQAATQAQPVSQPPSLMSKIGSAIANSLPTPARGMREWNQIQPPRSTPEQNAAVNQFMAQNPQALSANTEMGMGGITMPEAQQATTTAMRQMASTGARVGLPAVGQVLAGPAGGFVLGGAGEAIAQTMEPGPWRAGAIASNAVAGSVPLGPMANASGNLLRGAVIGPVAPVSRSLLKDVVLRGGKLGAANVAAKNIETGVDEQRATSMSEDALALGAGIVGAAAGKALDKGKNAKVQAEALARELDRPRMETVKLGRELGLVLPPAVVAPGTLNNQVNSLGGKAATAQEVITKNAPIINKAVADEIGWTELSKKTYGEIKALRPESIETLKLAPNGVYAEVGDLSPQAKILLEKYKQDQFLANKAFSDYYAAPKKDPSLLAAAKESQKDANGAFASLEIEAANAGKSGLTEQLKKARVELAKIGLVERGMQRSTGHVDPEVFGDAYAVGVPLSGKLETIGRFQDAFWRYVKLQSESLPSGVNQFMRVAGPAMAGTASHYSGAGPAATAGMIAAAAFAPDVARKAALSKLYQNNFMNPSYGATRADVPALVAALAAQQLGRQPTQPRPIPYR